jgi:hypothetical protein
MNRPSSARTTSSRESLGSSETLLLLSRPVLYRS